MNDYGNGPEERNIIGDLTEEDARAFFEDFCGWECLRSNYDYIDEEEDRKRGLDILYNPYSPYIGSEIGIAVSVKFRSNRARANAIKNWIYDLKNKVENADDSSGIWDNTQELFGEEISVLNRGILFLNLSEFNNEDFHQELKDIEMENLKRKNPVSVNILTNNRLIKLCEVAECFNNRRLDDIKFLYDFYGQHRERTWDSRLSYSYVFSDIILARDAEEDKDIAISFDEPTKENIDYLLDTCGEDGFHHTPDLLIFGKAGGYNQHDVEEAIERSKTSSNFDLGDYEVKLLQQEASSLNNKDLGEVFE